MNTIGNRIRSRRKELAITQKALGKIVDVSHVTISQWESDVTRPKGENLHSLSKALQKSSSWLLYGKEENGDQISNDIVFVNQPAFKKIPLISWVKAGIWASIENQDSTEAEEWRDTTAKVSSGAFALRVVGDSMINPYGFPSIPEGSIVIVDPDTQPENGKIVVARLNDTNEATLKKLVIDGPNRYLKALNPDYKPIQINGNCTIVGVVKKVEFDL